jgi:hypothetical protein
MDPAVINIIMRRGHSFKGNKPIDMGFTDYIKMIFNRK